MCRFLLVKSKKNIKPKALLTQFAAMAKISKAPDGDWQGDGWGIAWVDGKSKWQVKKSLSPVWEDTKSFGQFPDTNLFVVHARSASFPHHEGILEYNQPYVYNQYAFVFNGLLKGVALSNVPGRIGAEKIWHLLQTELKKNKVQTALEKTKKLLLANSKEILALNIGVAASTTNDIYSLSYFTKYKEYYQLHTHKTQYMETICSEALL